MGWEIYLEIHMHNITLKKKKDYLNYPVQYYVLNTIFASFLGSLVYANLQ